MIVHHSGIVQQLDLNYISPGPWLLMGVPGSPVFDGQQVTPNKDSRADCYSGVLVTKCFIRRR